MISLVEFNFFNDLILLFACLRKRIRESSIKKYLAGCSGTLYLMLVFTS